MVEIVEILDRRLGKHSVERVRYVINNLLHLVIVKYGVVSLVLCISTRLRLLTILSLLVKYLVKYYTLTSVISLICVSSRGPKSVGGITWAKHACSMSVMGGKIRPVTPVIFNSTVR